MNPGYLAESVLGYEQITNVAAAVGFTAIPAGTARVLITPETQAVRWRADGTDPTATVGYPLAVGNELVFTASQMSRMKFIEQVAGAKLNITYLG
jgi:hypothetical protein